uniref:EGF-like domain-containing protein n=1 Tax=Magallana gigas TaxID=29159 RepID=A0A8W8JBD6_MAGGI
MAEVGYSNQSTREPYLCCSSTSISVNDSVKSDNCATGFYGPKCELPCRHPNYGELCHLKCECIKQYCNHITGCQGAFIFTTVVAEVEDSNQSTREPYQCCSSTSISVNDSVKSDKCATGFYRPKIKCIPCRYPSYGELCQLECE